MNKHKFAFFGFNIALILVCQIVATQQAFSQPTASKNNDDPKAIQRMLQNSMKSVEATKYNEFIDPKNGLVQARYPIPKSWKVNSTNNPIYIQGPNKLRIYKNVTSNYAWSNDPMMQQTMQMQGQILAPPMSSEQFLNQYIRPNAEADGYHFVKSYALPEASGLWQRLIYALPRTGSQSTVEALGAEWTTPSGTKSLIVLITYYTQYLQSVVWGVQTSELESNPSYFEEAKKAYIYSYANAQLNPQWVQHMGGQLVGNISRTKDFWAKASAQSAAAHQQRMSAIAARGASSQSTGSTYSDILDISHKGYLNRSNINSEGHDKTVRSINEVALIGNHETGEHYEVPTGANYYWVSQDGYYFGTDNALLNPNSDNRMNDKNWTKFAVEQ